MQGGKKDIFQHFGAEERSFVEKMLDLCQRVQDTYAYEVTAFLNPREEEIIRNLASSFGLQAISSQSWLASEFSRVVVAPDYYSCQPEDFELQLYQIIYPVKFYELTHAQILGTILNRLGIRREFVGDIWMEDGRAYVLIDRRFSQILEQEIQKIAKAPVQWKPLEWQHFSIAAATEGKEGILLVSSLRLDKLVATGFGLSRATAAQLIEKGFVKLNYQEMTNGSKIVEVGSLISVRGKGRLQVQADLGFSKQGKVKLQVNIIKK